MPLGPPGTRGPGPMASLHPAANSAAATSRGSTDVRLHVIGDVIPPPYGAHSTPRHAEGTACFRRERLRQASGQCLTPAPTWGRSGLRQPAGGSARLSVERRQHLLPTRHSKGATAQRPLSARTVASHVPGRCSLKNQVHRGSADPALPCTAYAAPCFSHASVPTAISVKPGGAWRSTNPFVMVTPYTSAPAFTAIAPGLACVVDEPNPESDR